MHSAHRNQQLFLHCPQADLPLQLKSGIFLCRDLNTFKVDFCFRLLFSRNCTDTELEDTYDSPLSNLTELYFLILTGTQMKRKVFNSSSFTSGKYEKSSKCVEKKKILTELWGLQFKNVLILNCSQKIHYLTQHFSQ